MKNDLPADRAELLEKLRKSILKVLKNDGRSMPLKVLMHKVFGDFRSSHGQVFVRKEDFAEALEHLMEKYLVARNEFGKYFIEYMDYEETDRIGEGYLEIDEKSGNGFITIKKYPKEYKKSSHFVHRKNLNGAKFGDYVRFCELRVEDRKRFEKFPLIDARVKKILPKPQSNEA